MVTCPEAGDNSSKGLLIPHVDLVVRDTRWKGLMQIRSLREGPASHQLVGKVTAYQGDDG